MWGLSLLAFLLGLPLLQSYTAFLAVTSVAVIGLNIAYGIPIFLRVFVARHQFEPGPFSLGRCGGPALKGDVGMQRMVRGCKACDQPSGHKPTVMSLQVLGSYLTSYW